MFDACHMQKLAKNFIAEKNNSSPLGDIDWKYIVNLNTVQEEMGMKFANKLSPTHINYKNNIMKVKLAVQTLSSRVADAIEYLMKQDD